MKDFVGKAANQPGLPAEWISGTIFSSCRIVPLFNSIRINVFEVMFR